MKSILLRALVLAGLFSCLGACVKSDSPKQKHKATAHSAKAKSPPKNSDENAIVRGGFR